MRLKRVVVKKGDNMKREWHSAESVTEGQPDKLCDQIVDRILDSAIEKDRFARVEVDALATAGLAFISGHISTKGYIDITKIVRNAVKDAGYTEIETGFDFASIAVLSIIEEQSSELALAVDKRGAGNQGVVVGYATRETEKLGINTEFMPIPIWLAHKLAKRLADFRKAEGKDIFYPDGQVQVTFEYESGQPKRLVNLSVAAQHKSSVALDKVREAVMDGIVKPTIEPLGLADDKTQYYINPAGTFTIGGPKSDTGISNRKQVVDAYGPFCRHGGVALCGKDPTKTDRSASYMARYLAKNLVAAGLSERCEVRLAYTIGLEYPTSLQIECFQTGKIPNSKVAGALWKNLDLSTPAIINHLNLLKPIYAQTSCYGHFGKPELPWEKLDLKDKLLEIVGKIGA